MFPHEVQACVQLRALDTPSSGTMLEPGLVGIPSSICPFLSSLLPSFLFPFLSSFFLPFSPFFSFPPSVQSLSPLFHSTPYSKCTTKNLYYQGLAYQFPRHIIYLYNFIHFLWTPWMFLLFFDHEYLHTWLLPFPSGLATTTSHW